MESTHLKGFDSNGHCEMESTAHLLYDDDDDDYDDDEDSSGSHYLFGNPRISPRVGDNYQVEIPSLLTDFEYDSYVKTTTPIEEDFRSDLVGSDSLVGLPVSAMNKKETDRKMENNCCLVSDGVVDDSWDVVEEAGFVLGLYTFGKNLVQVKRLVQNKTMGSILSFYYGKFYRSNGYRRWSEGRKIRSRKFVQGHRIFSGFRQQELLSRLSAFVSEENLNKLSQVSKSCSEGKMTLEEYVSTLKATVGMKNLVEAVGIGKGKLDLTRTSMEPTKSNNNCNNRSEAAVPVGKSCSSLTPAEIVSFLTGDFRLSKTRTNDLFWESVWPLLLARGWQSEQPKDYNYAATFKNSLVFLIPGIKKFSRRSLVKGSDYFDSITDVLNKVVSDPTLLELDNEPDENNRNKEWANSDLPDKEHQHCYLQPRLLSESVETMKFMVVDTSMAHGKPYKVRELRTDEESSGISSEDTNSADTNGFKTGKNSKKRPNQPKKHVNPTKRMKEGNSAHRIGKVKKKRKRLASCINNNNHLPVNSNENGETSKNAVMDLNVAQPPPLNCGTNELVMITTEASREQLYGETRKDPNDVITTSNIMEQQNDMNIRRHGTRNRPPTMRALEALANGFLTVNSKKKDTKPAARRKKKTSNGRGNAEKNGEADDVASHPNGGDSRPFFALNERSSPRD